MENNRPARHIPPTLRTFFAMLFCLLTLLILPFDSALADCNSALDGSLKFRESTFLILLFFGFSITAFILYYAGTTRIVTMAAAVHLLLLPTASFFLWRLNLRFHLFDDTAILSENADLDQFFIVITAACLLAFLCTSSLLLLFTSLLRQPFYPLVISGTLGVVSIFIYYTEEPIGCSLKGGYPSVGKCQWPICLTPASDGGKICRDSSECQGTCIPKNQGQTCPGVCSNIELKKERVCWFRPDHLKLLGGQYSCERGTPVPLSTFYCFD